MTRTLADVYLVRDYLASEGVRTEIRNEHLFGAQGEVPVTADALPSLWADDDLVARARELIEIHRSSDGADAAAALEQMQTDASPEAQGAMSSMFEAADQLTRVVKGAQVDEVQRLGAVITASSAPFGIEPALWERIGALADEVVAAHGDEDRLVASATQLRDMLRDLV